MTFGSQEISTLIEMRQNMVDQLTNARTRGDMEATDVVEQRTFINYLIDNAIIKVMRQET